MSKYRTDKGTADSKTIEYLKLLRDKKIFLFGTCGFGGSEAYFDRIITNVRVISIYVTK